MVTQREVISQGFTLTLYRNTVHGLISWWKHANHRWMLLSDSRKGFLLLEWLTKISKLTTLWWEKLNSEKDWFFGKIFFNWPYLCHINITASQFLCCSYFHVQQLQLVEGNRILLEYTLCLHILLNLCVISNDCLSMYTL